MVSVSERFVAASLPHGTLIKFKATWCDFNLNVNLMCFPFILLWCALSRGMLQAQIWPLSCFSVLLPGSVWCIFLSKAVALQWRVHRVRGFVTYNYSGHSLRGQLSLGLFCQSEAKNLLISRRYYRSYKWTEEAWRVACSLYIKRFHNSPYSTSYEKGFKTWTCEKEEKYWNVFS